MVGLDPMPAVDIERIVQHASLLCRIGGGCHRFAAIGVPPQQFPILLFLTKFVESLSHANLRWNLGWLRHLIVSPQFHRVHHGIGVGHEGAQQGVNFAVVFSFWDKLFGTADLRDAYPATGVRDQLDGRNYGLGFWETQWLGLQRLKRHFWRR